MVTFFISMFMLVLQFTWLYIDDLMGKGLEVMILMELLFYVSASLIPLALPLSILLSSIMTLGNLSESNELTALKSSGLSLFKILRPLRQLVILIAIATFFFSNYVIPVANLKWHTMIYDIQSTKVNLLLTPGSYSSQIEGYSIKVDSGKDNSFVGIIIHDYTDPNVLKTIQADSGTIYNAQGGKYLLFHLINGKIHEEMQAQAPVFTSEGKPFHGEGDYRPKRTTKFKQATYKLELVGFDMTKSREELFVNQFEMLNVFQIRYAKDSIQKLYSETNASFNNESMGKHGFFASESYKKSSSTRDTVQSKEIEELQEIPEKVLLLESLSKQERIAAVEKAIVNERAIRTTVAGQIQFLETIRSNYKMCQIQFHSKFALSGAIIVLFFIGAPLGAIVRKGGFGAPVVIAALLFMVYFVLFSVGESLAGSQILSPLMGMWLPTFVLIPFALILMVAAANDLPVFSKNFWRFFITFGRKR